MTELLDRVAAAVEGWRSNLGKPLVVGLCGAQGSGKTTLAENLKRRLEGEGAKAAILSLDDLYLSRDARRALAEKVHPLLATRGVPGTHDVDLGINVLDALRAGRDTILPRFNKAADDVFPPHQWFAVTGAVDVVLFEGWCIGAIAQPVAELVEPVNSLERDGDADGVWRAYVNQQLAGPYAQLFTRMDRLIFLAAPNFTIVYTWRLQQEHELRRRSDVDASVKTCVMTDAQVSDFIQYYQRLTEYILREMPLRADITLRLDATRHVIEA